MSALFHVAGCTHVCVIQVCLHACLLEICCQLHNSLDLAARSCGSLASAGWKQKLLTVVTEGKALSMGPCLELAPRGLQLGDVRKGSAEESNLPMDGPHGNATSSALDCISQGTASSLGEAKGG